MSDRNYTTKDKIIQIKVALEITYDNKPNYRLSLIHHEINQTILVYIIHPCVTFYRVTCYGTEWHFKIFRKKFEASSQWYLDSEYINGNGVLEANGNKDKQL